MKNEIDYKALGIRIKNIRKNKNWTQDDLASASHQTKAHISHIETGITKLSLPAIVSIANSLEVTVDSLLCDSLKKAEHLFLDELNKELLDCSVTELKIIVNTILSLKNSIRDIKINNIISHEKEWEE